MCGIVGAAGRLDDAVRASVLAGLDCIAHRGPDDTGSWTSPDGQVSFGHRRLAIIDLSPGGHQPMHGPGDTTIVFNGEIYNFSDLRDELRSRGHDFRTASDTEVILAAYREWDTRCVERFNGQFAFAVFDAQRSRVFLARDRAGEKPLFYRVHDGELRFASELKALMANRDMPRTIDPEALDCYLAMGFIPGDRCILRGVRKLPPAHALTFDVRAGATRVWRYWQLPALEDAAPRSDAELLDELESLLADAVRRQLVADVPVGVLLSGGVDSSLVTAMAARALPRVTTFTVRFPGADTHDETEHARLIASHFGTTHIELDPEPSTADLLPTLATQFDEPMVDSSMVPTFLVSRLVREHCTVALGGDGGDELFGGYPHYRRLLRLAGIAAAIPRPLRRFAAASARTALPIGTRGRSWFAAAGADFEHEVPPVQWLFDRGARAALMSARSWATVAERIHRQRTPSGPDLLQRATRMDFENYLAEDILVKVDRASMLTSLEVRAPFLDHRVVEFAFARVPSAQKASASTLKVLLKKLCGRVLPPAFDSDRKQGFSIPLARWLERGPWAVMMEEVLLARDTLFDRAAVRRLLDGQQQGRDNGERLFALTLFELWRREYGAAL